MPLNRRIPFFYLNKNQQLYDQLKQNEYLKQQKQQQQQQKKIFNENDFFNDNDKDDDDDDDDDEYDYLNELQSEKLFHTICVGSTLSKEFSLPNCKNINWVRLEESIINLFKNSGHLLDGQLKQTHEDIAALLNISCDIFVFERLKSQVLTKAVRLLKSNINDNDDDNGKNNDNYLETLGSLWKTFYHDILSTLECMLFSIEPTDNLSIRKTTLIIFRDQILIDSPIEDILKNLINNNGKISTNIIQMILIINNIYEPRYPPSENRIKFQKISSLIIKPLINNENDYYCLNYYNYYNDDYQNKQRKQQIKYQQQQQQQRQQQQRLLKQQNNLNDRLKNQYFFYKNLFINNNNNNNNNNQQQQTNNNNKNKWNRSRKISLPTTSLIINYNNQNQNQSIQQQQYFIDRINE